MEDNLTTQLSENEKAELESIIEAGLPLLTEEQWNILCAWVAADCPVSLEDWINAYHD